MKKYIYIYLGSLCIQFSVETCNISLDVLGGFGKVRSGRGQRKINMGLEIRGSFGRLAWRTMKRLVGVLRVCAENTRESVKLRSDARTGQWIMVDCWKLVVKGDSW